MTTRVGLAQLAPEWLDRKGTTKKVVSFVDRAAQQDCQLIVFGESLLPGYPFWLDWSGGAAFNNDLQKDLFAHYASQAVDPSAGDLQPIQEAARLAECMVVLGTVERASDRGSHSLYCSLVTIDQHGKIANVHRKLMPTYEERLVWSPGDGHGLRTHRLGEFTVGALNCWENWMALSRVALYGQGENLHLALWPGALRNTQDITRFIAQESRSYVISVSGLLKREHISGELPHADHLRQLAPEVMANGGSCVAGPDGQWLLPPIVDEEGLWTVDLDLNAVLRERQNFDPTGHYSRPDVTRLHVDRQRQSAVQFND